MAEMLHLLAQQRADYIRLCEAQMKELALSTPAAARTAAEKAPIVAHVGLDVEASDTIDNVRGLQDKLDTQYGPRSVGRAAGPFSLASERRVTPKSLPDARGNHKEIESYFIGNDSEASDAIDGGHAGGSEGAALDEANGTFSDGMVDGVSDSRAALESSKNGEAGGGDGLAAPDEASGHKGCEGRVTECLLIDAGDEESTSVTQRLASPTQAGSAEDGEQVENCGDGGWAPDEAFDNIVGIIGSGQANSEGTALDEANGTFGEEGDSGTCVVTDKSHDGDGDSAAGRVQGAVGVRGNIVGMVDGMSGDCSALALVNRIIGKADGGDGARAPAEVSDTIDTGDGREGATPDEETGTFGDEAGGSCMKYDSSVATAGDKCDSLSQAPLSHPSDGGGASPQTAAHSLEIESVKSDAEGCCELECGAQTGPRAADEVEALKAKFDDGGGGPRHGRRRRRSENKAGRGRTEAAKQSEQPSGRDALKAGDNIQKEATVCGGRRPEARDRAAGSGKSQVLDLPAAYGRAAQGKSWQQALEVLCRLLTGECGGMGGGGDGDATAASDVSTKGAAPVWSDEDIHEIRGQVLSAHALASKGGRPMVQSRTVMAFLEHLASLKGCPNRRNYQILLTEYRRINLD